MSGFRTGLTSAELALRALKRWGDRTAFSGHGGHYTYRQALDLVGRYQAAFQAQGMRRGQRVAFLNSNRADAWLATVATSALGLCGTSMHPLGSLEDHLFILEDAGIDWLVVDGEAHGERGRALAERASGLTRVFTLGPSDFGIDLTAAAEAAGAVSAVLVATAGDDSMLAYTGGTTGKSKGVLRQQAQAAAMTDSILGEFEWSDPIVYLSVAPLSHVGGTKLMPTLIRGGRAHFHHGFDPERILHDIEAERITTTLLVPTMIYMLLDQPALDDADLSSLQLLLYGASPMSPTRLREGLTRIGPVFSQLYGQSECYPISVLRREDHNVDGPDLFASCGHPCSAVQVSLRDDDNEAVADGEVGEICVRAPHMMSEYWKRPEQTEEAMAGGWLHTGDMARADERGYLYIVDRKKDMIVTGGFNVYPREVEDVLSADPAVAMAAVIGVPDEKWGEAVKAVVVPRAGQTVDTEALIRAVREHKGAIMAPKTVDIADEIPLTAIGKPDKKALRERYWRDRDRRVG